MKKLNNKGVTLVELIVSFALVGVAIIYFFNTLNTVKKVYANARSETNNYINVDYDLRIISERLDTIGFIGNPNPCEKYNLTCSKVTFAGYFSGKNSLLSSEDSFTGKTRINGNKDARDADMKDKEDKENLKGYRLKVNYDNGKSYYLYKSFKKLNTDGTALFMTYFPGVSDSITGDNANGDNSNYTGRKRVIAAKGVGTIANYEYYKEFTTNYTSNKSGIHVAFAMATNCDNAINKTTFIFGNTQLEVTYSGKNWDDANIYEKLKDLKETFHERNNSILNGLYVDPANNIIYNQTTYDGHHSFKYFDKDDKNKKNELTNDEAFKRHSTFVVGGTSAHLGAAFSSDTEVKDKLKVKVELVAIDNRVGLDSSCSAYTSIESIGTSTFY